MQLSIELSSPSCVKIEKSVIGIALGGFVTGSIVISSILPAGMGSVLSRKIYSSSFTGAEGP